MTTTANTPAARATGAALIAELYDLAVAHKLQIYTGYGWSGWNRYGEIALHGFINGARFDVVKLWSRGNMRIPCQWYAQLRVDTPRYWAIFRLVAAIKHAAANLPN